MTEGQRKYQDLTNQRFFRLVVLGYSHTHKERIFWNVKCDCGDEKAVCGAELRRGGVKSCGCLPKELAIAKRKPKQVKIKFGHTPKGEYFKCPICSKEFYKMPCFTRKNNYCSRACAHTGMSKKITLNCKECGNSYKVTNSFFNIRGSKFCSRKCVDVWRSKNCTGANSPAWRGGVSYLGKRIRKGLEWRTWRKAVFERDNYTCQDCGIRSAKGIKVELHPHHIKQYALYPELRFDINNGQTLCKECHKKTDTYLKPPKKIKKENG